MNKKWFLLTQRFTSYKPFTKRKLLFQWLNCSPIALKWPQQTCCRHYFILLLFFPMLTYLQKCATLLTWNKSSLQDLSLTAPYLCGELFCNKFNQFVRVNVHFKYSPILVSQPPLPTTTLTFTIWCCTRPQSGAFFSHFGSSRVRIQATFISTKISIKGWKCIAIASLCPKNCFCHQ